MRIIFSPAAKILGKYGFSKKFTIITAAFVIPTLVASGIFYQKVSQYDEHLFVKQKSLAYFKPLYDFEYSLQNIRDTGPLVATGDKKVAQSLQKDIQAASSALSTLVSMAGQDVAVHNDLQNLQRVQSGLKKPGVTGVASSSNYTEALKQAVSLAESIGINSDLFVENSGSTYLLSDVIAYRVPVLSEDLSSIRAMLVVAQTEGRALSTNEKQLLNTKIEQAKADFSSLRHTLKLLQLKDANTSSKLNDVIKKLDTVDAAIGYTTTFSTSDTIDTSSSNTHTELGKAINAVYKVGYAAQPILNDSFDAARNSNSLVQYVLFGLLGLSSLLIVYLLVGFYINIHDSIQLLKERLKRLTDGDLRVERDSSVKDEIGAVLETTNTLSSALADIVGRGLVSADSVHGTSKRIAIETADLAQRTDQQFEALKLVGERMKDLTGTVRQNVENASTASKLADDAADDAQQGEDVMNDVVDSINRMRDSSVRVNDIVKVIQDIANRTDILAINATIEAARAGEAGRGFSVVANEVRKLSVRSANAALEIQSIIGEQAQQVEMSVERLSIAKSTLDSIVGSTKRVKAIMGAIAASSKEQNDGITRTNESVLFIRGITEQNNDLVESTSRTAKVLQQDSMALRATLGQFKIADSLLPILDEPLLPELSGLGPLAEHFNQPTTDSKSVQYEHFEDLNNKPSNGNRPDFEQF